MKLQKSLSTYSTYSTQCSSERAGELGVKLKVKFERGSDGEKEQVRVVEV